MLATLAVLLVVLGPVLLTPLKEAVKGLRGYPAWWKRATLGPEAPPFGALAASQVGYGPFMVKQFSSPRRFGSFKVVSASGEVAFQGGPPVRANSHRRAGRHPERLGGRLHPAQDSGALPHSH